METQAHCQLHGVALSLLFLYTHYNRAIVAQVAAGGYKRCHRVPVPQAEELSSCICWVTRVSQHEVVHNQESGCRNDSRLSPAQNPVQIPGHPFNSDTGLEASVHATVPVNKNCPAIFQ
jgi:hypothetical protein